MNFHIMFSYPVHSTVTRCALKSHTVSKRAKNEIQTSICAFNLLLSAVNHWETHWLISPSEKNQASKRCHKQISMLHKAGLDPIAQLEIKF